MSSLTQERLKELFEYDEHTGNFTRLISTSTKSKVGQIAGSNHIGGYIEIGIDNKSYMAHRLVWLYVHGHFPKRLIDHIDGNRKNNKLNNLREANHTQNMYNSKIRSDNNSGIKCVSWNAREGKWEVRIKIDNKLKYFGMYSDDDFELAKIVAEYVRKKYHGEEFVKD